MLTSVAFSQEDLSAEEFFNIQDTTKYAIVLDVRIYEEYEEDRIPGSVYAGEKKILMELIGDYDSATPLLIYCKRGERSKTVIDLLKEEGFIKLYHLKRGYEDWKIKGFPVDNENID